MAQAPPFSAQQYLLEDHPRTLFPLTTTKVVVTKALSEIQQQIAEIFDQKTLGRSVAPSISYGKFREAIREAFPKFKHALAFDISSYFNSVW